MGIFNTEYPSGHKFRFVLRDATGRLKAELSERAAGELFCKTFGDGEWRVANYKSGPVDQYIIGVDMILTMTLWGSQTNLYIWADDKIDVELKKSA